MILTTFTPSLDSFPTLERMNVQAFYIQWWNACTVLWGQEVLIRETVGFGGYGVYLKWRLPFYRWNTSCWFLSDAIEDWYAVPPGSMTPITCPPVSWGVQYIDAFKTYVLGFTISGNDNTFTGGNFPLQSAPHYRPILPPAHQYNWQFNAATFPTIIHAPNC